MRVDPNYVFNLTAAVDQSASEEDTIYVRAVERVACRFAVG